MRNAYPGPIISGIGCYLLFLLLSNLRWKLLLDAQGMRLGFSRLMKIFLVGIFFNNLLPTTIGGDVARILYTRGPKGGARAISVILMDRGIGFIGLFFLAGLAAGMIYLNTGESALLATALIGLLLLVLIIAILFSIRLRPRVESLLSRIRLWGLGERGLHLYHSFAQYRGQPRILSLSFLLSVGIQIALSAVWYFIGVAEGGGVAIIRYLLYIPIIGVISMIPLTPGGLGIREASFYGFFTAQGLTPTQAVSIALIYFMMNLGFGVVGGLIFIFLKQERREYGQAAEGSGGDKALQAGQAD
jgi:hypothetical protein